MAYLYAGLGIAMLTGIMAIFEMATSYVQFQNTWQPAPSDYYIDSLYVTDKKILQEIEADNNIEPCNEDKEAENKMSFELDEKYDFSANVPDFEDGCSYASSGHRIIFDSAKGLWSCALPSNHPVNKDSKCDFEV
ncbi:hypothetical protein PMIT1313_02361 [Prochlorococcus marinus str. MIT 1313]|uniref:hypothetical protein n=1 Tax=Prochlorococcus TaxID=1218 RepID=UPI0007B359A5|nr:hypothetical protein [Prochlorococcus marinus]KZR68737.1 hypothetical protein PMIT1313_02361 [Prochlorococcus marinus str. MIT 1313]